jgi:ABC-2 type transport system ATP-binding protein
MGPLIEIREVRKTYPNGAKALQGVNLSIYRGEIFGVLGPNGAGKTTLLNCISTLLVADAGEIEIFGQTLPHGASQVRRRMNLCSGNANFPWSLTIRENLRFYAMLYGLRGAARERKLDELVADFSLAPYADRRFDEVSTGTKQRLALAKAMINGPELLLLDEPTVGMDPDIALRVRKHIADYHRRTGCTILLTTHNMPEAQMLAERVAFIREGKVLALGTPGELQEQLKARDMEGVFLELAK